MIEEEKFIVLCIENHHGTICRLKIPSNEFSPSWRKYFEDLLEFSMNYIEVIQNRELINDEICDKDGKKIKI